ncbi:MAG TPA: proteasome subunit alpha [Streptosporangiaceae bacterium]|jgi:proteasome alpha subunit
MPFYVSPEQAMKDKADYARKAITRGRSGVVIECDAGILFVSPNPSRALHKFSELYDRIAFAAAGRYNEFERLRQAGVRYADLTGYQYDRQDVTARGLANWYAQVLGTIFTESNKPLEVEIVVAEVGDDVAADQIYRITFDGTVTDEHDYLVMGGQADQVATILKDRYTDGMTLAGAMQVAIAALAGQGGNGQGSGAAETAEISGAQFEVAILDRSRSHRTFRRLIGSRLEALLAEARPAATGKSASSGSGGAAGSDGTTGGSAEGGSGKGSGGKPAS